MIFALASKASSISPILSRPCFVGQQHFGAFAAPLHRAADLACRPQRQAVFDVLPALGAEAAADIVAHHAYLALRHLEHHVGEHVAHAVRVVDVGVQRVAVLRRVEDADGAARFHVLRVHAGDDIAALHDVRGAGEGGFGGRAVAAFGGVRDVVRVFVPHARGVGLRRGGNVGDRGQRFVLHVDQFGGVFRLREGLRDHHRHRVADIAHAVGHQCRDAAARTLASRHASCAACSPSASTRPSLA